MVRKRTPQPRLRPGCEEWAFLAKAWLKWWSLSIASQPGTQLVRLKSARNLWPAPLADTALLLCLQLPLGAPVAQAPPALPVPAPAGDELFPHERPPEKAWESLARRLDALETKV